VFNFRPPFTESTSTWRSMAPFLKRKIASLVKVVHIYDPKPIVLNVEG